MKLDRWEQSILAGERGPALRWALEVLVEAGERNQAERMVPITGAHVPRCSAALVTAEWIEKVQELAESGAKVAVPTTSNPASLDRGRWRELGFTVEEAATQEGYDRALAALGVQPTYTCSPFMVGNVPALGEHVAWGDNFCICYANSILGARTEVEVVETALAAALIGRTPLYGLRLDEARRGNVLVQVETPLRCLADYGSLGHHVASVLGRSVPVFVGIPADVSREQLGFLAATISIPAPIHMMHVVGVTPEAPTLEAAFAGQAPAKTIRVAAEDLRAVEEKLNTASGDKVDWIYIGCPHVGADQLREVAALLQGKRVDPEVMLWVGIAKGVRDNPGLASCVKTIESAGGHVVGDTCPICTFHQRLIRSAGFGSLTSDSAKIAAYAERSTGLPSRYGSTEQCIKAAISGKWG